MALKRRKSFLIPGFTLLTATLAAAIAFGVQTSVRTAGASIESVTTFSALDGGESDLDGVENGVLSLQSLDLYDGGTIIIDVPTAEFDVAENLTLRGHAAIRVPYDAPPEFGPHLTIRCGGQVTIRSDARLYANGASAGGRLIVCAEKGIDVRGDARVSADGVGPDARDDDSDNRATPFQTSGGDVWMQSPGRVRIRESARVSASGSDGGTVRLVSCDDADSAIEIKGAIWALGYSGVGGSVDAEARQGGIRFDDDDDLLGGEAVLGYWPAIVTKGSDADGVITLTAATSVEPNPPPTFPDAIVTEDAPSAGSCDQCFHEDPNDCDDDGVPNLQEIVECEGDPSCDDCNLNGVPDECDIAFGDSEDLNPTDGVPDECFGMVAGGCSPPSDHWSCFDNWALPGDLYPDDLSSAANVHVTLGGGDFALLDVNALIPTLRLLPGAILRVTNDGPDGDLSFSLPAKILNLGAIFVSGNRTVGGGSGIPPLFTVGPDGLYGKDPSVANRSGAGSGASAGLTAMDLILEPGRCTSPQASGGVLRLEDSMTLNAVRDIYLRGSAVANCVADDGEAVTQGGVSPPPKLTANGNSVARAGSTPDLRSGTSGARIVAPAGNLHLEQIVEISIRSSVPMVLLGDFDNRSISPGTFDWFDGGLSMEGTTPQTFEVAGRDVGPSFIGIYPQDDPNFSMGLVRIGAGSDVAFVNAFANTVGVDPCDEAVYVRELDLEPGSHITLDNCRIYYAMGSTASANVTLLGCGALVQLVPPAPRVGNDACVGGANANVACGQHAECPGGSCLLKNRFASFIPAFPPVGDAFPMGIKITAANLAASSVAAPAALTGQPWWVQAPTFDIVDGLSPAFDAALVGCSYVAHDLSELSLLHAYGSPIVPGSSYDVQVCTTEAGPCSAALRVDTATFADITPPLVVGQPTFQDVMAIINKFLGNPTGPSKTRVKLHGSSPDPLSPVNFQEVSTAVDAFKGKTFVQQFPLGPAACP